MKALVGPNELAPTGFPRGEDARRLVAHTCALSQLFARAQLCRADRRQDLERLGAAASAGIRIAAKLMAVGSRLGSAARPLPSSPWSLDVAPPDAVGLPTLGLASPRRACLVPSLSVRPPESRPKWESAVELRPRDARPWARHGANFRVRHMSDRESADALSRRLVVEWGRIRCAWGGEPVGRVLRVRGWTPWSSIRGVDTRGVLPPPVLWSRRREMWSVCHLCPRLW